jgi:hypothetical protein
MNEPSPYAWLFEVVLGSLAAAGYNFHKIFEGSKEHAPPEDTALTIPGLTRFLEKLFQEDKERTLEFYMNQPSVSSDYMASMSLEWNEDGHIHIRGYSGEFLESREAYCSSLERFKQAQKDRELDKQLYAEAGYAVCMEAIEGGWQELYDKHSKQYEGFAEIRGHACSLVVKVEERIQKIDPHWEEHDFNQLGNVVMTLWLDSFPSMPKVEDILERLKY